MLKMDKEDQRQLQNIMALLNRAKFTDLTLKEISSALSPAVRWIEELHKKIDQDLKPVADPELPAKDLLAREPAAKKRRKR